MSRNLKREINEVFYVLTMFIIFMGVYIFLIKTGLSERESKNYSYLILIAACLLRIVVPYIAGRIKIKTDADKWSREFNNASEERRTEMLEASMNELDKRFERAVKEGLISVAELEEIKKKAEESSGA